MKIFWTIWLVPRNLAILLLKLYRKIISPLYGDVCRYYPSCSAYGLGQLQQRGLVIGSLWTLARILRCNPWSRGGVDEVRPTGQRFEVLENGFVSAGPKGKVSNA
ncbi:MAG: membrane protein insertion efficiency factor YidD [Actinomycetota bacterium]